MLLYVDVRMHLTLIRGITVHVFVQEMFDTGLSCVEPMSVQTLGC